MFEAIAFYVFSALTLAMFLVVVSTSSILYALSALAAGMIFMCKGDHITRSIVPHGKVLIHQGSLGVGQMQTHQFLDVANDVKKDEEIVKAYVLENTTITAKLYERKKKNEWSLDAKECIKSGVCDKIIENIEDLM